MWEGERGVALPLRPPAWWYVPLFVLLTLGMVAALVAGLVRLVRGQATDGILATIAGFAVLMVFVWLFALATKVSFTRRRDPGQVIVTPTWLVADRVHAQWATIDALWAHQELRQGRVRAIDIAAVHVRGRTILVYEAGQLDIEPRAALEVLRRLHLDDRLRDQLGTVAGPGLFVRAPLTGETT